VARWAWYGPALLSPDGRTLVRIRNGGLADPTNTAHGSRCALQIWDTATGKSSEIVYGIAPARQVQWCGPRRLLAGNWANNRDMLIDLDARTVVVAYAVPKTSPGNGLVEEEKIRGDPAGRLWVNLMKPDEGLLPKWKPFLAPHPEGKEDGFLTRPGELK